MTARKRGQLGSSKKVSPLDLVADKPAVTRYEVEIFTKVLSHAKQAELKMKLNTFLMEQSDLHSFDIKTETLTVEQ